MTELSFRLLPDFIAKYKDVEPPFGFRDAGGNSLGEITYVRTYSRLKDSGEKEDWLDACKRVTDATYTIQKNYVKEHRLEWNDQKAQSSAKEFFDRLFNLKWTPPGRGLQQMGSSQVMSGNSASLQNCGFVSTGDIERHNPGEVFEWAMLALMYGIGIGADTLGSKKGIEIRKREGQTQYYTVPDSREGWAESLRLLINSYLRNNKPIEFDYSLIRPKGAPLVSFGGKASGSAPLIRLHRTVSEIFDKRVGETLNAETIADIMNLIGACVIAGSTRRSAEIILGEYDDNEFLNLKNPEAFPVRNSYDPENPGWAWASNNSVTVPVGADYNLYKDRIVANGEPGLVWLDVIRSRGRMKDAADIKDVRAKGVNPSMIAGTRVFTTNGVVPIEQLEGETFFVKNLNGGTSSATCWKSGEDKPVFDIHFKGGWKHTATPEHKWPVFIDGQWVRKKTSELVRGDKMRILPSNGVYPLGEKGTYDEGFLIGWNLGDGWQTSREKGLQIGFMVSQQDRASGIDETINKMLNSLGSQSSFNGKDEINVNSSELRKLFIEYGVKHKSEGLPESVWDSEFSDDYRRGIIDGLFSSDGDVDTSKGAVNFVQKSKPLVDDIMDLLGLFGVKSSVMKRVTSGRKAFLGHPAYLENDKVFESYRVQVCGLEVVEKFYQNFTLSRKDKQERLKSIASRTRKTGQDNSEFQFVEAVVPAGVADVWDVAVNDETHAFQLTKVVTGNCGEQNLESYELCTLTTVHINNAESKEDFLRTLKHAFLYAKTVTLMPTPWTRTNSIMQRNRRIGLSLTGITDFVDKHGLPELLDWMEDGYQEVRRLDGVYSEWLCIRESNRVTTIKPEGSVSLLSGASPGVHWGPGGKFYMRAIRFGNSDPMLHLFSAAGYKIELDLVSDDTSVVYFPMKTDSLRSEKEVSIFEKIGLAAKAQHQWSDNGVSVTVSFDRETEGNLLVPALRLHEGSLKAVSFLPMSNEVYPQQPYTQITEEEYYSYIGKLGKIDFRAIYDGIDNLEAIGEKYCSNDGACSIM